MAMYFLTQIDGIWHVRERGQAIWSPVAPDCRNLGRASRIVKAGDPRAVVAIVPRHANENAGNAAG